MYLSIYALTRKAFLSLANSKTVLDFDPWLYLTRA